MSARGRRCGSSASMLCSRDSSRPCHSATSTVVVRERSYTAHDTAPVSQILSQYPGILRRYPRYQGGILAVLYLTEPVALATSHTTHCCYTLRRSRRLADRAAQLAASRSGTRWERSALCRRSRCGDSAPMLYSRDSSRPARPVFCSYASVLRCVWAVAGRWALL